MNHDLLHGRAPNKYGRLKRSPPLGVVVQQTFRFINIRPLRTWRKERTTTSSLAPRALLRRLVLLRCVALPAAYMVHLHKVTRAQFKSKTRKFVESKENKCKGNTNLEWHFFDFLILGGLTSHHSVTKAKIGESLFVMWPKAVKTRISRKF